MDGFEVTTETVISAGEAASRIASTVTGLDLAAATAALGAALPGSRTAVLADQAGRMWASDLVVLGGQVRQHADALGAAAGAYRDTDTATANRISAVGSSGPPAAAGLARPI